MSNPERPPDGVILWTDLTVPDAEAIRDFYSEVAGWDSSPVDMDGYEDFNMCGPGGEPIAGICHARGKNVGLPAQWLIYVIVSDLDGKAERCKKLGGEVLVAPKGMGTHGRYCVIRDPAGAVCALFEPA
jgi:predicted enzyme related to lactoylglutathione lyase